MINQDELQSTQGRRASTADMYKALPCAFDNGRDDELQRAVVGDAEYIIPACDWCSASADYLIDEGDAYACGAHYEQYLNDFFSPLPPPPNLPRQRVDGTFETPLPATTWSIVLVLHTIGDPVLGVHLTETMYALYINGEYVDEFLTPYSAAAAAFNLGLPGATAPRALARQVTPAGETGWRD